MAASLLAQPCGGDPDLTVSLAARHHGLIDCETDALLRGVQPAALAAEVREILDTAPTVEVARSMSMEHA